MVEYVVLRFHIVFRRKHLGTFFTMVQLFQTKCIIGKKTVQNSRGVFVRVVSKDWIVDDFRSSAFIGYDRDTTRLQIFCNGYPECLISLRMEGICTGTKKSIFLFLV